MSVEFDSVLQFELIYSLTDKVIDSVVEMSSNIKSR